MNKKKDKTLQAHFWFKDLEIDRKVIKHAESTGNKSHWYREASLTKYKKEIKGK